MSHSDEIRFISKIKDVETAKHRRTYHRGQMTKLQTKLDTLKDKPLRDLKLKIVKQHFQSAKDKMELHEFLQHQMFELLSKTEETAPANLEEECRHDAIYEIYFETVSQVEDLAHLVSHYQEGVILCTNLEGMRELSELSAPALVSTFQLL